MPQTVWIARHANRLDFVYPAWFDTAERRYDPPLSDDGHLQAQQLAQRLQTERIAHIFCSPFLRAIQTGYPVAEALDLSLKLEAGLGEWHNPDWMSEAPQTCPRHLLEIDYPRIDWRYSSQIIPEYPESENALRQRTADIAQKLVQDFADNILLVGHSHSVIGAAQGLVQGQPVVNAPLCGLVKVMGGEKWQIILNGDISHLSNSKFRIQNKLD